jgi:hypothetical protein
MEGLAETVGTKKSITTAFEMISPFRRTVMLLEQL